MEPASDRDSFDVSCPRQSVRPARAGRAESVPMTFWRNKHISGARLKHRPPGGEWLKAGVREGIRKTETVLQLES